MPIIRNLIYMLSIYSSMIYGYSLMLDPAGDAQHAGRMVHDTFERGITLQCAEQLKKKIESINPTIRTILTRFPGESVEPLQNAHFANRLDVDLYISIHCYQEKETKPQLSVYYVSYNDHFITKTYDVCFYPYDQAHRIQAQKTNDIVRILSTSLSQKKYARLYDFKGNHGLPIKPLIGIKSPAILIELSLKNSSDWQPYIEPIAHAIIHVVEHDETTQ